MQVSEGFEDQSRFDIMQKVGMPKVEKLNQAEIVALEFMQMRIS